MTTMVHAISREAQILKAESALYKACVIDQSSHRAGGASQGEVEQGSMTSRAGSGKRMGHAFAEKWRGDTATDEIESWLAGDSVESLRTGMARSAFGSVLCIADRFHLSKRYSSPRHFTQNLSQ